MEVANEALNAFEASAMTGATGAVATITVYVLDCTEDDVYPVWQAIYLRVDEEEIVTGAA